MRFNRLILILAMAAASHCAVALNKIPNDPDVKIGSLPNGLTYYVRHNAEPAGQADFFLAQRVGSIQEEESQRGLAHFLEHMCFNGTEHFPGNSMIDYLESVGVKFGANLNAYTASDETVYNICEVPVRNIATQDSCLLILRDWSHGLLLDDADIDAERGVIEGEWRQRQDAPSGRLLEKTAPIIYGGSIYGKRLPIGKIEVVRNFDYATLRDFYKKWYNPENQCLIVVGDVDPAYIEAKIQEMFADIPRGNNKVESVSIPANGEVIATYQTDSEQPYTAVTLYLKHDTGLTEDEEGTIAEIRSDFIRQITTAILVDRFDLYELDPTVPLSNVGIGDLNFLLSRHQPALLVRANAKNGDANECVKFISQELKRAATHGFAETELDRAKLAYKSDLDAEFAKSQKTTNTQYARKYVRHYLDGGALPSAEAYYKMMKGVISTTTLDEVNAYMREVVRDDNSNVVIYVYAKEEKPGVSDSTLADAYASIESTSTDPYVDSHIDIPLMTELPTPGKIIATDSIPTFGAKVLTLSNGIKAYLKKTDFSPEKVSITAYSPGGFSQNYSVDQVPNYLLCNDALSGFGINGISSTQLKKLLVGKNVKCAIGVGNMEEQMSASASKADLPTAFQLLYLKATALTPDTAAYDAMIANHRLKFENQNANATFAMGDSIHLNVYNRHPLGAKLKESDLDRADLGEIMSIYKDRFGDMGDFSFFIVGDFDEPELTALIEQYVASLPSNGRREEPKDIGYGYYQGRDRRVFEREMEMPQSICYTFFNGDCEYNLENALTANMFGQVLASRLRKDLREDRGWTYGVKSHCSVSAGMNGSDPSHFIMPVYVKVSPGNEIATADIVKATVAQLSQAGEILPTEVQSIAQYLEKNYDDNLTDNGYWLLVLHLMDKFGVDMNSSYLDTVRSITPEDLAKFAQNYVVPASCLQLIMRPQ